MHIYKIHKYYIDIITVIYFFIQYIISANIACFHITFLTLIIQRFRELAFHNIQLLTSQTN